MNVNEIKNSSKILLTPADIAPILNCDPQGIRVQAQRDPSKLGYPVIAIGSRVRIPRIPFPKFLGVL